MGAMQRRISRRIDAALLPLLPVVKRITAAVGMVAVLLTPAAAIAELPAFPGAEGEGRFTSGGRGGDVYRVTSLDDAGPGSLREGLRSANGPRTIVFDVGGTIRLNSGLRVRNGDLTIAGETAPGMGILITQFGLGIGAPNVIVRHLRVRPGDARMGPSADGGFDGDAISISASDVMLDHVSTSWAIDENLSVSGESNQRITVQFATICECLDQTGLWHGVAKAEYRPGGQRGHSMGSLLKPGRGDGAVSFHHNLWSNNGNRNPAIGNYSDEFGMRADIRNNVIYNNRSNGYSSGESRRIDMNYVGNVIVAGPSTSRGNRRVAFRANEPNHMHIYCAENRLDGDRDTALRLEDLGEAIIAGKFVPAPEPFDMASVTTDSADAALATVLDSAGAFPWNRDRVDARLVRRRVARGWWIPGRA